MPTSPTMNARSAGTTNMHSGQSGRFRVFRYAAMDYEFMLDTHVN